MSVTAVVHAAAKAATQGSFRLPPMPTVGDILRIYRVRAQKHLAQNFLLDPKLTSRIVRAAGNIEGSCVLEVGPGPGSLTRSILNSGIREAYLIERDSRFLPALNELKEACPFPVNVLQGDILRYDLQGIFPDDTVSPWDNVVLPKLNVIANLPFNIATPLLIRWLDGISRKAGLFRYGRVPMTLMFQHEVAQRIIAYPGDPQRSRISVMCQNYCDVKYVLSVKGGAFVPKPDVSAGVVHLIPRREPAIKQPFKMVEKVVRNIFTHRRKTLPKGVVNLFPESHKHLIGEMLDLSAVPPERPPFFLDLDEFSRIVGAYETICQKYPEIAVYQFR